jgi:hypothetical protein
MQKPLVKIALLTHGKRRRSAEWKIYAESNFFRHEQCHFSARHRRPVMKDKRAALYLRVSTTGQTVSNQRVELEAAAAARGWTVVATYADEGISGAKTRHGRPQLDLMLKDAVRRKFDVVMVWAVDRLGRSLPDLIASMQDLHGAKVDLFIHQQGLDTTTASGRAMFGMLVLLRHSFCTTPF